MSTRRRWPSSRRLRSTTPARRPGFTLIELLVVVAIIALLISILLPSLQCARASARAAVCGTTLRGLGTGLMTYFGENRDWIPGVNTTGVALREHGTSVDAGILSRAETPLQSYDWITPFLRYDTDLGRNRAERFDTLLSRYACPSQRGILAIVWDGSDGADINEFEDLRSRWTTLSYLMPVHFQFWGQQQRNAVIGTRRDFSFIQLKAQVAPSDWEAVAVDYRSRLQEVGPDPSRKLAVSDATRYLDVDQLDFDVTPIPGLFGSFTTSGAWWSGSTAFGVRAGSANWAGNGVSPGSPSSGRNLALTYRHGCEGGNGASGAAVDNEGQINGLFFDGHVVRMDDRQSRNIEWWYPSGSEIQNTTSGMTEVNGLEYVP